MAYTQLIANAALNELDKKIVNTLNRRYLLWNMLLAKAQKKLGTSGPRFQWAPLTEDVAVQQYAPGDVLDYPIYAMASKAIIPARELTAQRLLLKSETDILQGPNGVAAYIADAGKHISEAMAAELNRQCFNDGGTGADDNGTGLHGIRSMTSATTAGTLIEGVNADTYAQISTAKDVFTADTANRAYGAWSPAVVDSTASDWSGSTDTWAVQGLKTIRLAVDLIEGRGHSASDLVLMLNQTDFSEIKNLLDSSYGRFDYGQSDPEMARVGFYNNFRYNGILIVHDSAVPSGFGYIFNLKETVLWSPASTLLKVHPVVFDPRVKGDLALVSFHGNFVFQNPAGFGMVVTA